MNSNINAEILAPAGSIETLHAAINAGADAVYIGGDLFGARAYANNPSTDELLNAIDFTHIHNKKIYLTVNTLLKNNEIESKLYDYIMPFYKNGLDALIVQDLGVFNFLKQNFPKIDLHASTQMAITGVDGARLMKSLGASRIVTARELSLNEINDIHNNVDIEIESFIHGAMCYCYSGMCLFSSILGGRSGNRGRCAGPCRQPYSVLSNNKKINDADSQYVLSLKDMNTLSILPEILKAGVYSLKIEGRMKSPEYSAGVVSIYKKYLDIYRSLDDNSMQNYKIDKNDAQNLADLYSRSGSTTGYYECHNSKNMISINKPTYKTGSDKFVDYLNDKYVNNDIKYLFDAKVILKKNESAKMSISKDNIEIYVEGETISEATNRPADYDTVKKQICKTGNTPFLFRNIDIDMDSDVFIPVKQLNEIRRNAILKFQEKLLYKYRRIADKEINYIMNSNKENTNFIINCSVQNILQLNQVLKFEEITEIYLDCNELSFDQLNTAIRLIKNSNKKAIISLPYIFRKQGIEYVTKLLESDTATLIDGFLIKNIDELGFAISNKLNGLRTDSPLYSFNQHTIDFLQKSNIEVITQPFELNYKELNKNISFNSELIVYGYIPLMVSAGCVNKTMLTCNNTEKVLYLQDRLGKKFAVKNYCNFCYNIIYNNYPISVLDMRDKILNLPLRSIRLAFTIEDEEGVRSITQKYIDSFVYKKKVQDINEFTRGHLNRGVE